MTQLQRLIIASDLEPLELRRIYFGLILLYKIKNNLTNINCGDNFTIVIPLQNVRHTQKINCEMFSK